MMMRIYEYLESRERSRYISLLQATREKWILVTEISVGNSNKRIGSNHPVYKTKLRQKQGYKAGMPLKQITESLVVILKKDKVEEVVTAPVGGNESKSTHKDTNSDIRRQI